MDLKKELLQNEIIMVVVPNGKYTKNVLELARQANGLKKGTCYVNLNQMSDLLIKYFKKNKVNCNNLLFVDMVTKTAEAKPAPIENVIFVSDPSALTEMVILINKILKKEEIGLLFFDSISTLLLYRKKSMVAKGIRDLISKTKKTNNRGIFIALEKDVIGGEFKEIESFIDKTIYIGKELNKKEERKTGKKI